MPKTTHRLTAITASNIKKPGLYPDGAGLYLRVKPSGSRSWVFRYMYERKPRYLGLGSAASVSLAIARSLAGDARRQLDLGQDPIEARRLAEREAAADKAKAMTFIVPSFPESRSRVSKWTGPATMIGGCYPR